MLADIPGAAVLAIVGQHLQYLKIDGGGLPGEILKDLFGIFDDADHDGDFGLLGDLESAIAEGQQRLLGFIGLALRVDAHGNDILIQKLHRFIDGLNGGAVILAVQRQAEAHMHELIDDGDLEILLFGDKGQGEFRKLRHGEDGIENGAVVADQQKAGIVWDLFPAGNIDPHPQQEHTHLHDVGHEPVVEAGPAVGGAIDTDEHRQQRHQQQKNNNAAQCIAHGQQDAKDGADAVKDAGIDGQADTQQDENGEDQGSPSLSGG